MRLRFFIEKTLRLLSNNGYRLPYWAAFYYILCILTINMFVNPSLLEIEFRRVCIFAFTFIMAKALVKPLMVPYLKCSYLLRLTVAFTPAAQVTS